ncbi:MAG: protein kinase [Parachlamydiales bacterium]|jgi:hypothetical protein
MADALGNSFLSLYSSSDSTSSYIENYVHEDSIEISDTAAVKPAHSIQEMNLFYERVQAASRSLSDSSIASIPKPVMEKLYRLQLLYSSNTSDDALEMAQFAVKLENEPFIPKDKALNFEILPSESSDILKAFVEYSYDKKKRLKHQTYILRLHGVGKHKKMYQATHLRTYQQKAILILDKSQISKKELENELAFQDILKKVKGCVTAKKIFTNDSYVILMTTLCNKGTLEREIKLTGELYERRVLFELYILSGIFAQMHNEKVLHGDIKPDNIMYTKSHKYNLMELKVIDFGSSRFITKEGINQPLGGPVLFLPPEATKIRIKILELKELEANLDKLKKALVRKNALKRYKCKLSKKRSEIQRANALITSKLDVYMLGETFYMRINGGKLPPVQAEFAARIKQGTASGKDEIIEIYLNMTGKNMPYKEPSRRKFLQHLIWRMLLPDQNRRPSMHQIHTMLSKKYPFLEAESINWY